MLRSCNLVTLESLYLHISVAHFIHSIVTMKRDFYHLNKPEMIIVCSPSVVRVK